MVHHGRAASAIAEAPATPPPDDTRRQLGSLDGEDSRPPNHQPAGGVAVAVPSATAHAAVVSRSILADAVSHEMRSTLALISGYSQSLLHLPLDDGTQRQYLQRISQAAESLTELADEVLDIAAADDGGHALRRRPVSLAWLVGRLARELAQESEALSIDCLVPPQLPLVDVDPVWISHVLRNLVMNAFKYGPDPSGAVSVRARDAGDRVVVTVADDGAGIDPDERERVFEAFYRGRRAQGSGIQGSGLGLYVCRQLVEAHRGRIWIEEAPRGTAVSFSLPRYRAPEPAPLPPVGLDAAGPGPAALPADGERDTPQTARRASLGAVRTAPAAG